MNGIIFDLDGTLWDSTSVVVKAWNQAIKESSPLNMTVNEAQLKGLFGKPLDEIMDALFPTLNSTEKEILEQKLYDYEDDYIQKEPCLLYPNMQQVIMALSKTYNLFIVSNCQSGYIELFLKQTNLGDYFTDYTCPGDTGLLKGDNIQLIMKNNNITSAIYVGDTAGDAEACKQAGIPIIYASYGFGKVEHPDYTITKISDLLTFDFNLAFSKLN